MSLAQQAEGDGARAGTTARQQPRRRRPPVRREIAPQPEAGPGIPAPFPMPALSNPVFSDRVFDIRDYGAVPDATTDCTAAIAKTIKACSRAGGGRVLVPPGTWLTGCIHLKSNIELHLADGATIRFSDEPKHYLPAVFVRWSGLECYNYSPFIYARDCDNIAITGRGLLVGQGRTWWSWQKREQRMHAKLHQMVMDGVPVKQRLFASEDQPLRPQFILPINCNNVLLEDFTICDGGPQWSVQLAYCHNAIIRNLRIVAPDGPNNDGIAIDSCRNVLIEDCDLHTHDDCIVLKSGLNEEGQRLGRPTENVVIRRIRATAGHGGVTIGSDMSGGVRNVFVHDCHLDGPEVGIRMKAARGRGGVVENIHVQDITMGAIAGDAIQLTTEYPTFVLSSGKPPTFRNIHISRVTCRQAKTAVRMVGLTDSVLREITLSDVTISADEGLQCAAARDIRLVNVRITPRLGPVLSLKDSQDVMIDGLNTVPQGSVFLDLRGRQTRNIRLCGDTPDHVRPTVVLGLDVPKDAIVHE